MQGVPSPPLDLSEEIWGGSSRFIVSIVIERAAYDFGVCVGGSMPSQKDMFVFAILAMVEDC